MKSDFSPFYTGVISQQTENHHIQNTAYYYSLWVSSQPDYNNMCAVMLHFGLKLYLTVSVCLGCCHRPYINTYLVNNWLKFFSL